MLYTGKGDSGTTKLFTTPAGERIPKTAAVFEALGTIDELVANLGMAKVVSEKNTFVCASVSAAKVVHRIQETLFIIQAELAGADMRVSEEALAEIGELTNRIEMELPPIKTFFIAGGTDGAALFDICRTIARRAERTVLRGVADGVKLDSISLAYLNRLSSVLYALARLFNHKSGITETPPSYL